MPAKKTNICVILLHPTLAHGGEAGIADFTRLQHIVKGANGYYFCILVCREISKMECIHLNSRFRFGLNSSVFRLLSYHFMVTQFLFSVRSGLELNSVKTKSKPTTARYPILVSNPSLFVCPRNFCPQFSENQASILIILLTLWGVKSLDLMKIHYWYDIRFVCSHLIICICLYF